MAKSTDKHFLGIAEDNIFQLIEEALKLEPVTRNVFQKTLTHQEEKKFYNALKRLKTSSSVGTNFGRDKCVQLVLTKVQDKAVEKVFIDKADIGNAFRYNSNTKNLVLFENTNKNATLYDVVSSMMFGSECGSALLKLLCLKQILKDPSESHQLAIKFGLILKDVVDNITVDALHPLNFHLLSIVLEKNIFLHIGSHDYFGRTFEFSNKGWSASIHMMHMNSNIYALFEGHYSRKKIISALVKDSSKTIITSVAPTSEFYNVASTLVNPCQFCRNFNVERCPHVLQTHINATDKLKTLFHKHRLPLARDVPKNMIDDPHSIPHFLKDVIHVKIDGNGDCFFSSVSFILTGGTEMAIPLRKAAAAHFISNEERYRLWFQSQHNEPEAYFKFKQQVLSTDRDGGENVSVVLSAVLNRPIVHFIASCGKPGRIISLSGNIIGVRPICILHIGGNHFQPILPFSWDNFCVKPVYDELAKTRNEIWLGNVYKQRSEKLSISNGKINQPELLQRGIRSADLSRKVDAALVNKPTKISSGLLELFTDIIKSELSLSEKLNHSGISKFVQRLSSTNSFWVPYIKKCGIKKSASEISNKARSLKRVQETEYGRQHVALILHTLGYEEHLINMFLEKAREEFKYVLHERGEKPNAQNLSKRSFVQYEISDFAAKGVTCLESTSIDDEPCLNITCPEILVHELSNQDEVDLEQTNEPQNNADLTDCSTLEEIEATGITKMTRKKEIAKALGLDLEEKHAITSPFKLKLDAEQVAKFYDFKTRKFQSGNTANLISACISALKGCCYNNRRNPYYYSDKSGTFCKFDGYCKCGLKMHVLFKSAPKQGHDVKCKVIPFGEAKLLQTKSTTRQIRGEARKELSRKLETLKPQKYLISETASLSEKRLLHGNQPVSSIHVPRKIRSENAKKFIFSSNIEEDLRQLKQYFEENSEQGKLIKGFIQYYSFHRSSINVSLYDESSLKLLLNMSKHADFVLHVDATGSVCKKENSKEILHFLVLASCSNMASFPVAHLLTQRSRASDLAEFFLRLKADLKELRPSFKKAVSPVIVTDMSLPIINGVLQGLNVQSMGDYLLNCYHVLRDRASFQSERSVISLCTNHLIKAFLRSLSKHLTSSKLHRQIRTLAVQSLVKIQESESLEDIAQVYKVVIEFFSNNSLDPDKVETYKGFLSNASYEEIQEQDVEITETLEQIQENLDKTTREASPFFQLFDMMEKLIASQPKFAENQYSCGVALQLLKNFYVPYTPLFSAAMLKKTQRSPFNRMSNAAVESEFNVIKRNFHGSGRKKLCLFIRDHHTYHVGKLKSLMMNPSKQKQKRASLVTRKRQEKELEENWQKNKQPRKQKFVRKRKNLSPAKTVNVRKILEEEIFTLSSDVLAKNITLENDKHVMTLSPNAFASHILTSRRKMVGMGKQKRSRKSGKVAKQRKIWNIDEQLDKSYAEIEKVWETTIANLDKVQSETPQCDAEMNDKVAEFEKDIAEEDRRKQREIDRIASKTKSKAKMKLSKHATIHNVENNTSKRGSIKVNVNVVPKTTNSSLILCEVVSNLPVLDVYLRKQELANFVSEHVWIEGNHVDFYLSLQKIKNPNSEFMVSSFDFCHKYSCLEGDFEIHNWNYEPAEQSEDPVNEMMLGNENKIFHYRDAKKVIHPLLEINHWCLLVLNFEERMCVILDSLMPSKKRQNEKIQEYIENVIPKFLPKSKADEAKYWHLEYCESMRQQQDVVSCGILIMAAAREIISADGESSIAEMIENVEPAYFERKNMLFEMLDTTPEGKALMQEKNFKYADIKEYLLK